MIYFIHDETNRTIKIGCSWNPQRRLSDLQISTSNKLVLLGQIAGMKKSREAGSRSGLPPLWEAAR